MIERLDQAAIGGEERGSNVIEAAESKGPDEPTRRGPLVTPTPSMLAGTGWSA
jgi:hypothetical protein